MSTLDTVGPVLASGVLFFFFLACSLIATPRFLFLGGFGALERGKKSKKGGAFRLD